VNDRLICSTRNLLFFCFLTTSSLVSAHHSFSLYSDEIIEVEGELVSVEWRNPHVQLTLNGGAGSDAGRTLTLEAGAGYILQRRGLEKALFEPGDIIVAAGRRHTRDTSLIWLHNILLGDGQELIMIGGISPRWTEAPRGSDEIHVPIDTFSQNLGIFRVWSRAILRPITYGDGLPYVVPRPSGGQEWIDRLNGYAERCEPVGMPGVMATPYPFEFIDRGSSILLRGFSNNAPVERVIWLNSEERPPPVGDRMGMSIGHWQDERILVVETTQIDWPYFDDSNGTRQGDNLETREIFAVSEDQSRLDYEMTVDDPETFSEPVAVIAMNWVALGESLESPAACSD
jgi:hypothetical protein